MPDTEAPPIIVGPTKRVDPRSLTPWPGNPRRHDLPSIIESIRRNGFAGVILVQQSSGWIVKGNGSTQAAIELGMPKVPVAYVDVDDVTARRILAADNRASELGWFDNDDLVTLLAELAEDDPSLDGSLYSPDDYDALVSALSLSPDDVAGNGNSAGAGSGGAQSSAVRSIVIPLSVDDYNTAVEQMSRLREAWQVDTNAVVVLRALSEALIDATED